MASGPRFRMVKLRLSALLRPHVPSISPKRPQRKVAKVASSVQSLRMTTCPEVGNNRVSGSVVGSSGCWSGSHQSTRPKASRSLFQGGSWVRNLSIHASPSPSFSRVNVRKSRWFAPECPSLTAPASSAQRVTPIFSTQSGSSFGTRWYQ